MKIFNIFWVHGGKSEFFLFFFFLGGGHEKPVYRGTLPKKGGRGQFADLRGGGWQEKRGVFEGGRGLISQCTLCILPFCFTTFQFSAATERFTKTGNGYDEPFSR